MTLTRDLIKKMTDDLGKLPPMPFFASSSLFERDCAMKFQFQAREYVGAHPAFWAKIPPGPAHLAFSPSHIPVHDLDLEENRDRRREFYEALRIILTSGAGPIEDAIATAIERALKGPT